MLCASAPPTGPPLTVGCVLAALHEPFCRPQVMDHNTGGWSSDTPEGMAFCDHVNAMSRSFCPPQVMGHSIGVWSADTPEGMALCDHVNVMSRSFCPPQVMGHSIGVRGAGTTEGMALIDPLNAMPRGHPPPISNHDHPGAQAERLEQQASLAALYAP